jgi:TPR repeat protein
MDYSSAKYELGLMYLNGKGMSVNHKKAFRWFKKSAEDGLSDAQYHLGLMFKTGMGVQVDNVLAYKWFYLADGGTNFSAYNEIISVEKLIPKSQKYIAIDLADRWVEKNLRK